MTYADELNDMQVWPTITRPLNEIQIGHMWRMIGPLYNALQQAEDREWPQGYDYSKDERVK